jgi:serine phosphatase RsbU (regulator of sigma subunit)/pSer/pThr/pTyr-binding forkhead associated (FHA) protein
MSAAGEAAIEVSSPSGERRTVRISESPFCVGRGDEGNHLVIADDRVSRKCAAICVEGNGYVLEDRGNRRGVFVNGGKVTRQTLQHGDVIGFGVDVPVTLIFQTSAGSPSVEKLVSRMDSMSGEADVSGGLAKLNLLLEATRLLHSQLPLEAVLDAMLDRALSVTDADRAMFLEADASGGLQRRLARRRGQQRLAPETFVPSKTAVELARTRKSGVITEDLELADALLQSAQSIVSQALRAVVAIPLYGMGHSATASSGDTAPSQRLLGVMYLDSQRRAAFSKLDRQLLDALAIECASVLNNARLVKLEQERQRVEQELGIARDIQQALLPRGSREFPHLTISGINIPCYEVGGDYFDIFPINTESVGFLIADVSGKGLGAALLTTMLQGAFSGVSSGAEPQRVFQHINSLLCDRTDVGRFATLFYGSLGPDGTLTYLNAGHPSPLILRRGAVRNLFTEGALPLGLIPEAEFSVVREQLEPGDTLVLFSDGITEAQNKNGEFFGETRFETMLAPEHTTALDALKKTIVQSVQEFTGTVSQADDVTVLLARYRAPA